MRAPRERARSGHAMYLRISLQLLFKLRLLQKIGSDSFLGPCSTRSDLCPPQAPSQGNGAAERSGDAAAEPDPCPAEPSHSQGLGQPALVSAALHLN